MRRSPTKQVRVVQRVSEAAAAAALLVALAAPPAAASGLPGVSDRGGGAAARPAVSGQPQPDLVARARALYNQQQYDAAIADAEKARAVPASADAARLVLARARLERFRQTADPQDLSLARDALREIRPDALSPRDEVEYLVGLGEALYLEDQFGAAAEIFNSLLESAGLAGGLRERVLDWWATATDRAIDRELVTDREWRYARMAAQVEDELARDPQSAVAIYWLAAARRAAGELDRAWDEAVAGWVRASLTRDRGAALRADLDRLMLHAIIPDRAREQAASETERARVASDLQAEWTTIKQRWSGR
jgi:hypothetical protein